MHMDKLDILLSKIRARPGLYLGQASFDLLIPFINGYITYLEEELEFHSRLYPDFNAFVVKKSNLNISPLSTSYPRVIRFISSTDEQAFYKFFELWDEFKATQKEES